MEFVAIILALGLIASLFAFNYLIKRRRYAALARELAGTVDALGCLHFVHEGRPYQVLDMSTQNTQSGYGGSYLVLRTQVSSIPPFLLVPTEGRKFHFLFKFPAHTIRFDHDTVLVTRSELVAAKLRPLREVWKPLLQRPSASLTVSAQWHWRTWRFQRVLVFEYVGLQKDELKDFPKRLEQIERLLREFA